MGTSTAFADFEIYPSTELEDVFAHFVTRFQDLPTPRSIVEARITKAEAGELMKWIGERWEPSYWCDDTLRLDAPRCSRQEMFGALLLFLATSVARDSATDDSIWPAVTKALREAKSFHVLFANGHPTTAAKNSIAAGARRLGLRNLIDRNGKQEYFDTLKLQFGFTYKGAVKRLGEWLDGFAPLSVKILNGENLEYGDLRSESFVKLWDVLKGFRKGRVAEEYARLTIHGSPWVREEWVDELLIAAAKERNGGSRAESESVPIRPDRIEIAERLVWIAFLILVGRLSAQIG